MSDVRPTPPPRSGAPRSRPGVRHLEHDVAVANTCADVLLTTSGNALRLTPEQARAIGWGLIEAAGIVEHTG